MSTIGHNNPPVDFDIDFNRAFRWEVGDDTGLSPTAKLILHTIALVMPSDGSGCFPGLKWISRKSGIPYGTVKRHMTEIRSWKKVSIGMARGRRGNTYMPNIDPEEIRASYEAAITEYVVSQKQSNALAGPPNDPPRKLGRSPSGPPKDNTGLAGSSSDPSERSRITTGSIAGSQRAIGGSRTPVAGSPDEPLLIDSKTPPTPSRDHGGSDLGSMVVPIKANQKDYFDRLNEGMAPFGDAAHFMVERMAEWMGKDRISAAEDLIYRSGLYGTMNVSSAFDATQANNPDRPSSYFNKVLERLNIEHGFRDLPERVEREMSAAEFRRTHLGREGL